MYGKVFTDNTPVWKPGINDFDNVKTLGLVNVDSPNYTGQVLDLVIVKNGQEYRDRMFPINPNSIRPRSLRDRNTGETREESIQEATERTYGEFNSRVKHIFTNFMSEEEFESVTADSFEAYINALTDKLPEDFDSKPGQVILGYNNGGYLEMPRYMWITGHFFSINGQKDLVVSDKVKVHKANSEAAEKPTKPVEW